MSAHILVIEDEPKIAQIILAYLEKEGYTVTSAADGEEGLALFHRQTPDVIILDRMIPKVSGDLVCTKIRQESEVPILILSARSTEDDRVFGLQIGADDYLTKPFSPRELVARVQSLLRRANHRPANVPTALIFNGGHLRIDPNRYEVRKGDRVIDLTPTEFRLLLLLATHPGQVFKRERLLEEVHGAEMMVYDRTVDAHIKNLRQKIEENPKKPQYIQTVFGVGYRFTGEVTSA